MTCPPDSSTWKQLQLKSEDFKSDAFRLGELVRNETGRKQAYSVELDSLLFDYSRNLIDDDTFALLLGLAESCGLEKKIAAMFAGEKINSTEQRAALHTALREQESSRQREEVKAAQAKMQRFVEAIRSGKWLGVTGDPITDVVNIGIGGSDLGPAMVCDALKSYATGELNVHFVSNIDPAHLDTVLADLNPAQTLFIVASKSFGTLETLENALAARNWLLQSGADISATSKHFIAVSSNLEAATEFGIDADNIFPMWDWVGGRYSLWSAIGLPIALQLGMDIFKDLLKGAYEMDRHFLESKPLENIPIVMALLSYWYQEFFEVRSHAVVPYSQDMELFPDFLQQLTMESLGKSVHTDGSQAATANTSVTWGTVGSNSQHSYFQLLHQGREIIPVDFVAFASPVKADATKRHRHLLANCFSQSLALMDGTPDEPDPHKRIQGNKPNNIFLFDRLNAFNLGMLIAAFEHKTYVQSVLWDINAFDQWGVELGKKLSATMFDAINDEAGSGNLDNATARYIAWIKKKQQ